MKYRIVCYIPVEADPDSEEIYDTIEDAEKDIESLELMQPENIYRVEEMK